MIRIGIGYDIHRLEAGKTLILGGVTIPFERGFVAHSDGDVLCHAVADALLGAAGVPNIGILFPDTDPAFKDADSMKLLSTVVERLREKHCVPLQMDANIIAQRPKLQPYLEAMKHNMAQSLAIPLSAVSIKPRTNEALGAEGRGEAISAQVVLLIEQQAPR